MQSVQALMRRDATRAMLEDWCRDRAQCYPAGDKHIIARVMGKFLMLLLQQDIAMTPHLALNGIWEPNITMAIARHLRPGMRCIDVGACYGYFSLLMADCVGELGVVNAWEPAWPELVSKNTQLNGLSHKILVIPNPMGTRVGTEFELRYPSGIELYNAGGDVSMEVCDETRRHNSFAQHVTMLKHDNVPFPIHFVKVDVEGAEADVWQSLDVVRARSPDLTVCLEFTPDKHPDPERFIDTVIADGFGLNAIEYDGTIQPISKETALEPDSGELRMLWLAR